MECQENEWIVSLESPEPQRASLLLKLGAVLLEVRCSVGVSSTVISFLWITVIPLPPQRSAHAHIHMGVHVSVYTGVSCTCAHRGVHASVLQESNACIHRGVAMHVGIYVLTAHTLTYRACVSSHIRAPSPPHLQPIAMCVAELCLVLRHDNKNSPPRVQRACLLHETADGLG